MERRATQRPEHAAVHAGESVQIAAFECLGHAELHSWFLCGVCLHVCDSGNQIWL